jgi:hypothetical protein
MPYLHQAICLSPQNSFPDPDLSRMLESKDNLLKVIEPAYPGIPAGAKRRMGKSVRMAVGAAFPILEKNPPPDGIVMATANGGMEDCIKFLNQILEYNEGLLTPANFVQSTSNAAAAQIAMISKNHYYNTTHVHRGLAFENALLDVVMLLKENIQHVYLLGCTDEISAYNYNIDRVAGWFRNEPVTNSSLFSNSAKGTIAGEGAFMCLVSNDQINAEAKIEDLRTIHSEQPDRVVAFLEKFMLKNFPDGEEPDLLISGENGDERMAPYYDAVENFFPTTVPVARFKHFCGEYCTSTSFACWLSIQIFKTGVVPPLLIKRNSNGKPFKRILIYNNYRGLQHAFILIAAPAQ